MLLAAVADILSTLGFDPMTDITFAATQALDAAEEQLASLLNTEFAAGTYTDMFYVDEPTMTVRHHGFKTQFRLSRGFITTPLATGSVLVNSQASMLTGVASQIGSTWGYVDVPTGDANIDVTTAMTVDSDRGLLTDIVNRYRKTYVQATYQAGFAVSGSDPTSYDLTVVPDWLQQAAKLCAMLALADSPSLSEAQIKIDKQLIGMQYNALMSRKLRYAPNSLLPL